MATQTSQISPISPISQISQISPVSPISLDDLPGAHLIRQGLLDFAAHRHTIEALLISIASPRLRRAGHLHCADTDIHPDAELHLYRLISQTPGDPYPRYNALLRQLISFEHALDHRLIKTTA